MKNNRNSQSGKRVVLLFPYKQLADLLGSRYLSKNYSVILVKLDDEKEISKYKSPVDQAERMRIVKIQPPLENVWESMDEVDFASLRQPDIVLNFMGKDLLSLNIRGQGVDWKIDPGKPAHQHFRFVDLYLKALAGINHCTWINIAYGQAGRGNQEHVFCNTRYGVTGLKSSIEMNPDLAGLELLNICLTYLKHREEESQVYHCMHCISEKFSDEVANVKSTRNLADFLVRKSEQLVQDAKPVS